jgi:hypothetical protein
MRRLILFLVMAPIAVLTIPASAQAEPVACPAPPEGTTVVGPNYSAMPKVESPLPDESATFKYQLDLSPATAANKASVGAYLEWEIPTSDFDLFLRDANANNLATPSERGQPGIQGSGTGTRLSSPYENVFALSVKHCMVFQVEVYNFAAPFGPGVDGIDPLQLQITTGARR